MAESVSQRWVTINLAEGLHMRPADAFVSLAKQFEADIQLIKDAESVDGKSILAIITLAAAQGEKLLIRGEGSDAETAVDQLAELVQRDFDLVG